MKLAWNYSENIKLKNEGPKYKTQKDIFILD
jgi:hypothetical protein